MLGKVAQLAQQLGKVAQLAQLCHNLKTMAQQYLLDDELQHIVTLIKQSPDGLKLGELADTLSNQLSRRTLQRRLSSLKAQGVIDSRGERNNTRYFCTETISALPLSTAASKIKQIIHQPLQQRKPVGYQPDFLCHYQPNKTFYLSPETRERLWQQGQAFHHALEPGTYVKKILDRLLIDLSWNSSRLEGNTYSLLETQRLIAYGATANEKNAFETQMIINHKEAIEFMVQHADFQSYTIRNIHALLANNLLQNPKARGQLRQIPAGIGVSTYHPPEIPQLIEACFQHLLSTAAAIDDPFEQAFFVMVQLPYLQPFEDVNKRVSRLVANIPFIQHNLSPLSFIDVPKDDYISGLLGIYECNDISLLRDVFVWAYQRSAQRYQLIQDTLTEPNLLQMRFKQPLKDIVSLIVTSNIRANAILEKLTVYASEHIPSTEQSEFIQMAEIEIASLHEGNIAVYGISLEDFLCWKG